MNLMHTQWERRAWEWSREAEESDNVTRSTSTQNLVTTLLSSQSSHSEYIKSSRFRLYIVVVIHCWNLLPGFQNNSSRPRLFLLSIAFKTQWLKSLEKQSHCHFCNLQFDTNWAVQIAQCKRLRDWFVYIGTTWLFVSCKMRFFWVIFKHCEFCCLCVVENETLVPSKLTFKRGLSELTYFH